MAIPDISFTELVARAEPRYCAPYKLYKAIGAAARLPRQVTLETTSACQLACKMCDRSHMRREHMLMPDDIFITAVHKIAPYPIRINFNGIGEPLLDNKLVDRIAYARDAGVKKMSLISNGLLLTPEMGKALIKAGLTRLAVSLDSIDQNRLDAVHNGSDYQTVAQNLEALIATRKELNADHVKIIIRLTVQQANLAGIPDLYRSWYGRVDDIRVNFAYQYGQISTSPVLPYDWDNRVPCPNTLETLMVLTNGATTICCLGDINAELNTGNIATDTVEHCFSGPIAAGIRAKHRAKQIDDLPVCMKCSASTMSNFRNAAVAREIERACVKTTRQSRSSVPVTRNNAIQVYNL
jgi:hypothetical protein